MSNLAGAMAGILVAGVLWGIAGGVLARPLVMYGGFIFATVAFIAFTALSDGATRDDDLTGWEDE